VDCCTRYKLTCYVLSLDFAVSDRQVIEKINTATGR
jgi:hypothetical protein